MAITEGLITAVVSLVVGTLAKALTDWLNAKNAARDREEIGVLKAQKRQSDDVLAAERELAEIAARPSSEEDTLARLKAGTG